MKDFDNSGGSGKSDILLEVKDLDVSFRMRRGELRAVKGISYCVREGEIMGLVGESGSGKSVEAYSILNLLKPPGRVNSGSVFFEGREILALSKEELTSFRGNEISMIFQNPMSYLDPVFTVGKQMVETVRAHDKTASRAQAEERSVNLLSEVMIRNPEQVMRQYPFELSGGICQRVMIAIALLCDPKLLIADEPTTALDVTTQSQVLQILKDLKRRRGMAIIYITHDLGVVAELCEKVSVMYGGYILERGTTDDIFYHAAHPYTRMLHDAISHYTQPRITNPGIDAAKKEPFMTIDGAAEDPFSPPDGCVFHPRCPSCMDICRRSMPPETAIAPGHSARCHAIHTSQSAIHN